MRGELNNVTKTEIADEVKCIKRMLGNCFSTSNYHYISVEMALTELLTDYQRLSEKYARYGTIKDMEDCNTNNEL